MNKQSTIEQDWDKVAILFHNTYEGLAQKFGYETRKDTQEFNPESQNGQLMIATCKAVVSHLLKSQRNQLIDEIVGLVEPEWEDPDIRGTFIEDKGEHAVYNPVVRNQFRKELKTKLIDLKNKG